MQYYSVMRRKVILSFEIRMNLEDVTLRDYSDRERQRGYDSI